ncbi:MAG TPA: GNAT family N-acetyltransferase, partial [Candidatus Elarobacter sp.]|nr:GNAT family N-acetyltransferase [Candidatus Elarobacter sp.]
GGSVADYFTRSRCGAIEFLTIAPEARGRGLGAVLTAHVEERMADAAAARGQSLAFVMAEMNDPFKRSRTPDNLDPFGRLRFWDRLGYRRAAFPYVQPALSAEQSPVTNLLLAAKPVEEGSGDAVEGARVVAFLRDYLIYAMRFDDPLASPEFVAMSAYLARRATISLAPFGAYLGEDPQRPLSVRPVEREADPDFAVVMALYHRAFANPALAVGDARFAALLRDAPADARYHLWALREQSESPVRGMASFFALPSAGFGGYVAFEAPLLHAGRLPLLIARIERALAGESPAAQGWYVECAGESEALHFARCGFAPVALPYRQPPNGPPLRLLYKEFGAVYAPPVLSASSFLAAQREIARCVYEIERPDAAPSFAELARHVAALPAETIPFDTDACGV